MKTLSGTLTMGTIKSLKSGLTMGIILERHKIGRHVEFVVCQNGALFFMRQDSKFIANFQIVV